MVGTLQSEYEANKNARIDDSVNIVTVLYSSTYICPDLALTRFFANHSISPESSDGLASVGTILPKEGAALLPGGLFAFLGTTFELCESPFPKRNDGVTEN